MNDDEIRFHALKFAAQTLPPGDPGSVLQAAEAYFRFLSGMPEPAEAPVAPLYLHSGAMGEALKPLSGSNIGDGYVSGAGVLYEAHMGPGGLCWKALGIAGSEVGRPPNSATDPNLPDPSDIDLAYSTFPAVEAVVDGDPVYADPQDTELGDLSESYAEDELDEVVNELFGQPEADFTPIGEAAQAVVDELAPTFEHVAAAVQEIAGSPPEPDASDEPEMTDYQVEALEDQTRAALAEDAAQREPERAEPERIRTPFFNPFVANPFSKETA